MLNYNPVPTQSGWPWCIGVSVNTGRASLQQCVTGVSAPLV